MYRVTTPTHVFSLPIDTSECAEIQVTYKQGSVILLKHYQDGTLPSGMTLDGNNVRVRLTQEETKQFDSKQAAVAQVRVLTTANDALASSKFSITIKDVLNEDILE